MPTEKELTNLVINKIENPEVFKYMQNNSLINADELYLVGGDDDVATQTENGLMSAEDKTKLDGIEKGAEVNVQTDWNEKDSTSDAFLKNKPTSLPANGGNADTVNGHTVKSNVPENAVFTDTTYDAAGENLGLVKSGGDVTIQDGTITIPSLGVKANKSTTLAGYGIEDAKISDGVITLGSNTITPVTSVNGKSGASVTLDKTNIGLGNVDNVKQYSASNPPPYPVTSVNGDTGAVNLTASDVGALSTQTGTQGQFLGFISDNVVGAVDAPTSTSPFNTSYNGTLASGSGNWTSSGRQYYQQFNLPEITSTQTPLVFPQWTTNITNEQASWNSLLNIQTFDGYVRFYASAPTTTNVNFVLMYTNYTSELVELVTSGSGTVGTFTPI